MKDFFSLLIIIICTSVFLIITAFVMYWISFILWGYVSMLLPHWTHWGDRNADAMSDSAVVQYVEDRIPIGSDLSIIETFIEQEKEEWPYYAFSSGKSKSHYILNYKKGNFKSWLGASYCKVLVYISKDNKVFKIKFKRTIQ